MGHAVASAELTLVLSGHVRLPQSADLRPFWRGFIELQKKLPSDKPVRQIVTQSWNPDLGPLARAVYAPDAERHEDETRFQTELMYQIKLLKRFGKGSDCLSSIWKNSSIQSVLCNAHARAGAIELMDELTSPQGQVLITYWDLGQAPGMQVNQIVADASLPNDYLYMSYSSEVDKGYADTWILAPWSDARRFGRFNAFVLDCLLGQNRYLERFSLSGWPRARVKKSFETWWSHPVGHRFRALVSKLVQGLLDSVTGDTLPERVLCRLTRPVQRFLWEPPFTAENSCVPGFEERPPVFPAFQAANVRALLKFFILSEGLRHRVRFLTHEDFDLTAQSGQLINPTPVVLLIHEADNATMASLLAESPLPLAAVYKLNAGNIRQYISDTQEGWCETVLRVTGESQRDLVACALDAELRRGASEVPVLVMPTVERYLGCTDWFYMNALMKYLTWSSTGYVGLASSMIGEPCLDFPDLQLVRGFGVFSLRMAAGTSEGLRVFLDSADLSLDRESDQTDRTLFEFPVVIKDRALF